jgi:hypothetical protein
VKKTFVEYGGLLIPSILMSMLWLAIFPPEAAIVFSVFVGLVWGIVWFYLYREFLEGND